MTDERARLRADCGSCAGLCCVAPAFARSADFAISKAAGQPCPHLAPDLRCGIHERLRERGFAGCDAYDCLGAGQQVVQVTYGGRGGPASRGAANHGAANHGAGNHGRHEPGMLAALGIMRALHELLWYLSEAAGLVPDGPLRTQLRGQLAAVRRLTGAGPGELAAADPGALRDAASPLLLRASEQARGTGGAQLRGADLTGRDLRRESLRAASLRGACLIGADLRGADLALADLTGADLRGADLRGADLSGSLFLLQPQAAAARGDRRTRLPQALRKPAHWTG